METGQIEYIGNEKARATERRKVGTSPRLNVGRGENHWKVEDSEGRRVEECEDAAAAGIVLAAISWPACSILGRVGIHPAVLRKSVEPFDCKRVVKYS
jgi:hypothetical protein